MRLQSVKSFLRIKQNYENKSIFQIILLFSLKKSYYFAIKYFMRIAIAGNIGAGKTSLTKLVSKSLGYTPYYEDVI